MNTFKNLIALLNMSLNKPTTTVYNWQSNPVPVIVKKGSAEIHIYRNGVRLALGVDYTIGSDGTVSWLPDANPNDGDDVLVDSF